MAIKNKLLFSVTLLLALPLWATEIVPSVTCQSTDPLHYLQVEVSIDKDLNGRMSIKTNDATTNTPAMLPVFSFFHQKEDDENGEYFYEYWTSLEDLVPTLTVISSDTNPGKESTGAALKGSIFFDSKNIELACQTVNSN